MTDQPLSLDEILNNPSNYELVEYELTDAMKEQGVTPAVYPMLIREAKAAIERLLLQERIDELGRVNKVNNSIFSDDPAAYYVNIQRHINQRLAVLTNHVAL